MPSSAAASAVMRRNRRDGGAAERLLRSHLWAAGFRFRLHAADLPGKPDLLFRADGDCVFCDGDFWHGRNWPARRQALKTGKNADYWMAKIRRNRQRDQLQTRELTRAGWRVIRLWETDILREPASAADLVIAALATTSARRRRSADSAVG